MIVQPKEIKNVLFKPGQIVGLTSGCFDLPHFYHLQYLQRCAAQCDVLIVGVDADDLILAQKGKAPAMPEHQRTAMIAALRCVDVVFTLRNLKDLQLAGTSAHVLFKNNPQIYGQPIIGAETATLVIIPDIQEIQSTTELKQKIRDTDCTKPYSPVVSTPILAPNVYDQYPIIHNQSITQEQAEEFKKHYAQTPTTQALNKIVDEAQFDPNPFENITAITQIPPESPHNPYRTEIPPPYYKPEKKHHNPNHPT